jgi:hypothetical protein
MKLKSIFKRSIFVTAALAAERRHNPEPVIIGEPL